MKCLNGKRARRVHVHERQKDVHERHVFMKNMILQI